MKPKHKILILLVILASPAFSQILVGPVVGGNYSFASLSEKDLKDIYTVGGVYGYHVGGHLAFKVKKRFFLHASMIYSTKGRTMQTDQDEHFKFKAHYNFIELPITYTVDFRAHIGNAKEFKYFFGVGPNISYWLSGKGKVSDATLAENNIDELSYKIVFKERSDDPGTAEMLVDRPNRLQFGLNFVAGMVFEPADRQRVMLTFRYDLGQTYLAKSNGLLQETYFQDPLKSRNEGFRISLAYLYDLKTEERNKGRSTIDKRHPR